MDQDCWSNLVAKTARRLTRAGGQGRLTTCRGISLCPVRRRVDRSTRADRSQYAMVYEIDRRFPWARCAARCSCRYVLPAVLDTMTYPVSGPDNPYGLINVRMLETIVC